MNFYKIVFLYRAEYLHICAIKMFSYPSLCARYSNTRKIDSKREAQSEYGLLNKKKVKTVFSRIMGTLNMYSG